MNNTPSGNPGSGDPRMYAHSKDADANSGERRANSPASAGSSVAHVADKAMDAARGVYQQVKDGADAMTQQTTEALSQGLDTGTRYVREGGARVSGQVRQHPTEALLIAGVVGLLLGLALAR